MCKVFNTVKDMMGPVVLYTLRGGWLLGIVKVEIWVIRVLELKF